MSLTLFFYFNRSAIDFLLTDEILKKVLKLAKTLKKTAKKNFNFFVCMRFYLEGHNFYYKNCLFDAKFFEFKESTIEKVA